MSAQPALAALFRLAAKVRLAVAVAVQRRYAGLEADFGQPIVRGIREVAARRIAPDATAVFRDVGEADRGLLFALGLVLLELAQEARLR